MKSETTESEVVDEAPVVKPRLSLVVILAMVLGASLMAGVVAVVLHVQSSNALKSEVLALKNELKAKDVAYENLKAQFEALSGQVDLLKEHAVARSSNVNRSDLQAPGVVSAENAADSSVKLESGQESQPEPAPPPRTKRPKSDKPNCELVGKSKEEQEETLKRCLSLIDPPK